MKKAQLPENSGKTEEMQQLLPVTETEDTDSTVFHIVKPTEIKESASTTTAESRSVEMSNLSNNSSSSSSSSTSSSQTTERSVNSLTTSNTDGKTISTSEELKLPALHGSKNIEISSLTSSSSGSSSSSTAAASRTTEMSTTGVNNTGYGQPKSDHKSPAPESPTSKKSSRSGAGTPDQSIFELLEEYETKKTIKFVPDYDDGYDSIFISKSGRKPSRNRSESSIVENLEERKSFDLDWKPGEEIFAKTLHNEFKSLIRMVRHHTEHSDEEPLMGAHLYRWYKGFIDSGFDQLQIESTIDFLKQEKSVKTKYISPVLKIYCRTEETPIFLQDSKLLRKKPEESGDIKDDIDRVINLSLIHRKLNQLSGEIKKEGYDDALKSIIKRIELVLLDKDCDPDSISAIFENLASQIIPNIPNPDKGISDICAEFYNHPPGKLGESAIFVGIMKENYSKYLSKIGHDQRKDFYRRVDDSKALKWESCKSFFKDRQTIIGLGGVLVSGGFAVGLYFLGASSCNTDINVECSYNQGISCSLDNISQYIVNGTLTLFNISNVKIEDLFRDSCNFVLR